MKKLLIGATVSAMVFGIMAIPAYAAPQGQNLNASQCNMNGAPLINITYKVINDKDSGLYGDWATDNYNKKVQAWDQGNGTFCAVVKYQGQFVTIGPASPQNGALLSAGIKGTFEGGYTATFDGTPITAPTRQTNGNLGTIDQSAGGFDWPTVYFGSTADSTFAQPYWSWTYHAGNNGTWVNAITGNSGDITGT